MNDLSLIVDGLHPQQQEERLWFEHVITLFNYRIEH